MYKYKIVFAVFFMLTAVNLCKSNDYYLFNTGNGALSNPLSWTQDPLGVTASLTPSAGDFSGGHNWHIQNRTPVSLNSTWAILTSGNIFVGNGTTPIVFTISGPGVIGSSIPIEVANNATMNINKDISLNLTTLGNSSTIVYGATQSLPLPALNYGNLTNSLPNSIGFNAFGTTINGILTLNGDLTLNGNILNLNGTISGTAGFVGDANGASIIIASNASNVGILNFAVNSRSLTLFELQHQSSTGVVSLGTDLIISHSVTSGCYFNLVDGVFDLNGHVLTIGNNADAFFNSGSGVFRGSSSSEIHLNGQSPTISTTIEMEAGFNTLKTLILDKTNTSNLSIGFTVLNILDSLSVHAGIVTTGGNLTLKSSSTLKGRIGLVGKSGFTGSISGNITVETYIPGATTGWANLGTNGISGLTVANWDGQIPMTCNGCSNATTTIPGGFASITEWDEVTDTYVTCSNTNPLTLGKGFWVYVGSGFSSTTDFTLSNSGTPKVGSGTIPVTRTSSNSASPNFASNLISNPYASPISWTKLRALGSNNTLVNSAIYVWNADLASGAGAMTSYVAGAGSPGGGAIGDDIPAGQGFFVDALAAGSLTYDESIKTAANTSATPLLKTSATNDYGKIFRLKLKGTNDWDAAVFRIHSDATNQFDLEWDAKKIFQSPGYAGYPGPYTYYTTLSSKDASGIDYSIQSIPSLLESTSIPVLARVSATGSYTIEALETENVHDCIMLKDNLTNTTTDLKLSNYVFTISDTTSAPRFELILCKDESLNTVGISQNTHESNSILIGQDATNAFVKTVFEKNTKATISVFNIMGQKLVKDIQVEGTVTTTTLPLDLHNQVVLIKVTTDKESVTKKVVLH